MTILGLHHIRFAVSDPSGFAHFLVKRFSFQYHGFSSMEEDSEKSLVLRHERAVFVIDKRTNTSGKRSMTNYVNEHAKHSFCKDNVSYPVDTVCDACFQCNNIEEILERVKLSGKGFCLVKSKVNFAINILWQDLPACWKCFLWLNCLLNILDCLFLKNSINIDWDLIMGPILKRTCLTIIMLAALNLFTHEWY